MMERYQNGFPTAASALFFRTFWCIQILVKYPEISIAQRQNVRKNKADAAVGKPF